MSGKTAEQGTSLAQTEVWVDREGREHLVDEMSVRYKANVIRFVERRAPSIVNRAVGRAIADAIISATAVTFRPVPCVQCEGLDGDGTMKIHRFEHGVDHAPIDEGKYPDIADAMVGDIWDRMHAAAPSYSPEEAVQLIRDTPLMQRLIADVEAGRGGDDG